MYDHLKNLALLILGCFILALGARGYIMPHNLMSGGLIGIAIIIEYLTSLDVGMMFALLNIPLFIFAWNKFSKKFLIYTLTAMLSLSFFLDFCKIFTPYLYLDDLLASCLVASIFFGVGWGLILKSGASAGGADIIFFYLHKKYGFAITKMNFISSAIIVLIGSIVTSFTLAVYTVIFLVAWSFILKQVLLGFKKYLLVLIISEKYQKITQMIMRDLGDGVTLLNGEGGYTNKKHKVIFCIITVRQIVKLKKFIAQTDPDAFVSISQTSEIQGKRIEKVLV
ncbi:YitT family protein [bacterium]|nr:YitT family protein [bacterium]MBT3581140.1 YitT family protein [bacterium]MBT5988712.1 YitT family protein [bacterium]MBT7088522.1 YitT family protein [bacterium]